MTSKTTWWASPALTFYVPDLRSETLLPYFEPGISAGFPSPASDYMDLAIDLNRALVEHPEATFYARVKGDSMRDAGIKTGDVLVIDRSLTANDGDIAICYLDGAFLVKQIRFREESCWLEPANKKYPPIRIEDGQDFRIWGVVTYVIKHVRHTSKKGSWVCMR